VGGRAQVLCRSHLVEAFGAGFSAFEYRMVVCPPSTLNHAAEMYPFYPVKDMVKEFQFPEPVAEHVGKLLAVIEGRLCAECTASARTMFFAHVTYDGNGPLIQQLSASDGEFLCAAHAFGHLKPLLYNHPKSFREAVCSPYGGAGIFVATFL
jgi:hypothetical protein